MTIEMTLFCFHSSKLPISELMSRWHLQLLTGKCKRLPSAKSMWEDIKSRENALKMRYYDSKRHTIGVQVGIWQMVFANLESLNDIQFVSSSLN